MATNPYVNKVQTADGSTIMDITDTTAEAGDVLAGEVFYAKSGQRTTGTLSDFTGATSSSDGTHGLVPAPLTGEQGKFLRGDGTWAEAGSSSTAIIDYDVAIATTDWSSSSPYTYTWSNATIVASTLVDVFYQTGARSVLKSDIGTTKAVGSVTFSADVKPTGTLNMIVRLIQNTDALAISTATQSVAGLMSAADKTKLDGVATGATANVGTVTGITMNSTAQTVDANGVVDLGTVITSHQDISGKVNVAQGSGNSGKLMGINSSGDVTPVDAPAAFTGATSSVAGTSGLVPAPAAGNNEKFLRGDGSWQDGGRPMVILSYGTSTWQDFINAYNNNVIVYCRASSNANPASGSQTRMAFMAYVNDASSPTNVEFQYYRSVSSLSASQQGDQVYVYKLTSSGTWTVTVREAYSKVVAGTNMSSSYSNGAITLSATVPSVVDNLTSDSTTDALSAAQGKALNQAIGNIKDKTITPQTLVSVDLDNITTTGVYLLGGSITHSPYGNYGYLIVIAQGTDLVQYYTNSNSAGTYIRRKYGGSWNDWEQLVLKSDFATVSGTFSSSEDTYIAVAFPTGFSADNSVIIGHLEKSSSGWWYSNNPSITTMADNTNGIRIKTGEAVFTSQPFKVKLAKI